MKIRNFTVASRVAFDARLGRLAVEVTCLARAVLQLHVEHAKAVAVAVNLTPATKLETAIWRNTTIIRDNVIDAVRALKAQPGKNIVTDGSSQLVHALLRNDLVDELHLLLYPLSVGGGKRLFPENVQTKLKLESATTYPSGVVNLHYTKVTG